MADPAPFNFQDLGSTAGLAALLWWFMRGSLSTLDRRLGEIVDKLGGIAEEHRTSLDKINSSHGDEVKVLVKRNEDLTGQLLEVVRCCGTVRLKEPPAG